MARLVCVWRSLACALRYLTIVPVPGPAHAAPTALAGAAPWFPVVGLGIGVYLVVAARVAEALFPALLAALVTVTAWKVVTGGLHLDGVADFLDGMLGRDAQHRLAIMQDSRIGAFGAIGLILLLLLELGALAELPTALRERTLLVVPAVGRAMPPLLAALYPAARPDGQGAAFRAGLSRGTAPFGLAFILLVTVLALGTLGLVVVAMAAIATVALGRFAVARLGGITGDVLGAAIELSELAGLLTASAWAHARL